MKSILIILLFVVGATFGGCLSDNIDAPDIKPRLIYPPGGVHYKSVTNTTDLEVRWNRSPSDTQQNFKGYFVQLFISSGSASLTEEDSIIGQEIDSVHTGRGDTIYTFHNIPPGRYTVRAWGERYPDAAKPDSVVLSQFFQFISFDNDPKPVSAPSAVYASSGGSPNTVNLFWQRSPDEANKGFLGYIIRYVDTTNTFNPKLITAMTLQPGVGIGVVRASIVVPGNLTIPSEKPYKFWVKSIRKDSVESSDSIGISWSGAERLPIGGYNNNQFKIDTGVFIGAIGTGYNIAAYDATSVNAMFKILYDGTTVSFAALHGTTFSSQVDTASSLDGGYFSRPFTDAELMTATSVSLPVLPTGSTSGAEVYALLPGGSRARIFVSSVNSQYIQIGNNLNITVSFQPIQPTYILPYF